MPKRKNRVRTALIASAAVALLAGGTVSASADTSSDDQTTATTTASDDVTFDFGADAVSSPVDDGSGGLVRPLSGGETSTKLSNGRLYFEARNGQDVTGNASYRPYFYSATKYSKSGGSDVQVKLGLYGDDAIFKYPDGWRTVKKGQSFEHNWGRKKISLMGTCSVAGFLTAQGQDTFYTPYVNMC